MSSKVIDVFVLYQIIKRISTPFDQTDAFKLGLIDKDGKSLRKARSNEEKKAMTLFDRFVFNIKRALGRMGLDTKVGTYAGALYLLRESQTQSIPAEDRTIEGINDMYTYLYENTDVSYKEMFSEDAPTVATGPAVAGTGDDPIHWGKLKGRPRKKGIPIDGTAFIKRMNKKYVNKVESKQ